jgi:hypothetical protein
MQLLEELNSLETHIYTSGAKFFEKVDLTPTDLSQVLRTLVSGKMIPKCQLHVETHCQTYHECRSEY